MSFRLGAAGLLAAGLALLAPAARAAQAPPASLVVCDDVQDPSSLDPFQTFSEKTLTLLQQMMEGLLRFDSKGKLEPALAVAWERIDPTTMRFHLRRGVKFHDGEPFDARSVKFSLERYAAPETHYPGAAYMGAISSVAIVDDYTVDVLTRRPDGLLLNRLAAWANIVPVDYYRRVGPEGFSAHPVGTGPFRFESWDKGSRIVLSADPDYWMKGYPKAPGLVFRFIPADKQFQALKSGAVDILTELPGTLTADAVLTGSLKVLKTPSFYTVTGALDADRPPLSDRRVRRALNDAINKEDLIRYDLMGNGHPIATVTMAGEEGHNPGLRPYPYDPQRALRLLKEAGYPAGFTLKTLVKSQSERAAKILRGQLAAVGVHLDLHMVADAEMIKALKGGRWDVFISDCPDPMAHSYFIQSIFLSGDSPYSLGKKPEYDRLLAAMAATLDDAKRRGLAEDLDRYVHDEALLLFTYQRIKTCGVGAGVEFVPSITGMPYFYAASKGIQR
ncbi:MAG TPA: ABC transporter substrate-binding protein [Elusimicrobiota bacterium]|nr:ABC transporter substrate-binding protein [Elusimicrobiota bacterium]